MAGSHKVPHKEKDKLPFRELTFREYSMYITVASSKWRKGNNPRPDQNWNNF